jgi:Protein of unknown function (DUF3999)
VTRPILIPALVLAIAANATVAGQPASDATTHDRDVNTAGTGPQRLAVDGALLAVASPFRVVIRGERRVAESGLSDLRLFTHQGTPVPYLLIHPAGEPAWVGGTLLEIAPTKKTSGFEADLGAVQSIDAIRFEGLPVPHLKRLIVEASGDRQRWTVLVAEGTIFSLPDEGLRQDTLVFTAGPYRFVRIIWNDANTGRVPLPRAVFARRVAPGPPPPATSIDASLERRPSEPGISRYRVRLPSGGLPVVALDLDLGGGHVYRRAVVTEARLSDGQAVPIELGSAMLSRLTRDGVTAAALRIPVTSPSEAEVELTIDDGANPPLEIRRISVVLAELPWIYFEAPPDAGTLVARFGNRTLKRPAYDLEAVRESVDLAKLPEAKWGTARVRITRTAGAPVSLFPDAGPTMDAAAFEHARPVEQSVGLVALPLDAHALALSRGAQQRFADVRLLDRSNRQIPYILERRGELLSVDLSIKRAADTESEPSSRSGSRQPTTYAIALPHANLPAATLVLETSARVFHRTVRVGISRPPDRYNRAGWMDVRATGTWRHADQQVAARPFSLSVGALDEAELRLEIDEGDNTPLPITAARLLLPSFRLRFYHPEDTTVRLVYGRNDLRPPQYDLALLAPQVMGAPASEVGAGAASAPATRVDPAFVRPGMFWAILGGAVIVLLGLIVSLIRRA